MPHICVIVEGAYPYVVGGVAQWLQEIITRFSDFQFSLITISAQPRTEQDYKYLLPSNVINLVNLSLDDENLLKIRKRPRRMNSKDKRNAWKIMRTFYREAEEGKIDRFSQIYRIIGEEKILDIKDLLLSKQAWELINYCYESKAPVEPFIDFYWSWRIQYLILYKLFSFELPKADIYHSVSTGYAGILGAIAKLKYNCPFILTEHGIYTQERELEISQIDWIRGYQKDMWLNMFKIMGKIAYSYADKIVCLFENARKMQLELGAPAERTEVVPNGIDLNLFSQTKKLPKDARIRIGLVGRVDPIKDVKTFICACKAISSKLSDTEFYIIGPCEENRDYYQQCRVVAQDLGLGDKVIFTGRVDTDKYYPLLDVLVVTSIKESQPLVVLEAMLAGIPVVATESGSLPEMLEDAGITVFPKDVQAVADGVIKFIKDTSFREKVVRTARTKVKKKYDLSDMIQRYREIYNQMGEGGQKIGRYRL